MKKSSNNILALVDVTLDVIQYLPSQDFKELFMLKDSNFFEKRFEEKRFVNVSVCQSNIKAKKGTYYGRVCKTGHIETKQLLQIVKERSPYIDIPMVESALEKIADVVLDMVGQGYSVEFSNLGTFSLSTQGKIEMGGEDISSESKDTPLCTQDSSYMPKTYISHAKNTSLHDRVLSYFEMRQAGQEVNPAETEEMSGNYDVSDRVKSEVQFAFKFSPSKALKASMKNIKMNLAIKKRTAPLIEKVEDALPERKGSPLQVIKLTGNNLKIAGDNEKVGVYIEETSTDEDIKHFMGIPPFRKMKISISSIIQNENKTLTLLLNRQLKRGVKYRITIITQNTSCGKIGKVLRKGSICTSLKE